MRKNHLLKTILMMAVLVGVVVYMNAFVVYNDIPPAFDSPANGAMETMTIEGTSFFLKSNADVFLLLNEVEVGYPDHLNFTNAQTLTDSAITKLETAREKYLEIITVGSGTAYVSAMMDRLTTFDYKGFTQDRELNGEIMTKLQVYLVKGDIMGLYEKNIENIDRILQLLYGIHTQLTEGAYPSIDSFWSLLQQYSDAILLGNYASMVFNTNLPSNLQRDRNQPFLQRREE
ncbi:MAG: hypothetical protein GY940_33610 [bacterium]|nr:hypothetical protein [bacterium]